MAVVVGESVADLEELAVVDGEELPEAGGAFAVRSGHEVRGPSADEHVVAGERGRPLDGTPELLDLAGVGVRLPQSLARGGEVGDDGHGECVEILLDRGDGHGVFLLLDASGSLVGVGEQLVETVDARTPDLLVPLEQRLGALDGVKVAANHPLATMRMFGHETCSLQDGDVLLDGSERHVVGARQLRDRGLAAERAPNDVASRRIGQRSKDPVHLTVTELPIPGLPIARQHGIIYNHMVVY